MLNVEPAPWRCWQCVLDCARRREANRAATTVGCRVTFQKRLILETHVAIVNLQGVSGKHTQAMAVCSACSICIREDLPRSCVRQDSIDTEYLDSSSADAGVVVGEVRADDRHVCPSANEHCGTARRNTVPQGALDQIELCRIHSQAASLVAAQRCANESDVAPYN
eukprot:6149897-Prymnesium_polylepis.7